MKIWKKSRYFPIIFTIPYSLIASYSLASLSNKREFSRETDKKLFNLSILNGGLAGFVSSRLHKILFSYNFFYLTLGMTISGIFYAFKTNRNKLD